MHSVLKLALMLLILGVVCLASFQLIGSTVDEAGVLHEPFILVIIGWFFITSGIVIGIIHFIYRCIRYLYSKYFKK